MDTNQLIGPLVLFFLMIVVGLQLTPADFRRVMTEPRAVVAGTLGQLILLPLMTWGLLSLAGMPPILGAGAVLLAAAPGAGMSNVMAAVGRANVALSVTLTAVSSVLAVVTLPGLTALGLLVFVGDAVDVEVPLATFFGQLVAFLLVPITLGMLLRARRPDSAQRYVSLANRIAVVGVLVLTALSAATTDTSLFPSGGELVQGLLVAIVWTGCAMAIGLGIAATLRLDADARFTFLVEFSARNIALAFIVAVTVLDRLELGLFGGAYAMSGFPLVIVLAILRGRRVAAAA